MSGNNTTTCHRGGCLCGAVRYEVRGPLRAVVNCHCEQCRRTSGPFVAASAAKLEHLVLTEKRDLKWYRSSNSARRGFCGTCGASLFWERLIEDDSDSFVSIMAGTLDRPTGLVTTANIFVESAGDYYRLDEGIPSIEWGGIDGDSVPSLL